MLGWEPLAQPQSIAHVLMRYHIHMLLCAQHISPVTAEPIEDGAVLVVDGRIVEIGSAQRLKSRHPSEEVRDFGQAVIMPGLVDLHTHLEYTALRGIVHDVPYAEWLAIEHKKADQMTRDERYDSAYLGCLEMIAGGVTTLAEFTSSGASCEALHDLGLRAHVYRSVGATDKNAVDIALDEALVDVNRWRGGVDADRIAVGIAPKALHACHPTLFRKVNELAARENLPIAMHIAGSYEEYKYIKYGSTPLSVRGITRGEDTLTDRPTWLPTGVTPVNYALNWDAFSSPTNVLAVHCVHVDEDDVKKLKQYDVAVAVSTRCNAQLGMGLTPLQDFLSSGLRVGLGTDSPAATDTADMFIEMRLGMLIHRAVDRESFLSAQTMLELATIGGARALRMEDEIGSLDEGKRADLIVVDLSASRQTPLVDPVTAVVTGASASDVIYTMVGGMPLFDLRKRWAGGANVIDAARRCAKIRTRLKG